jgi:hypothetical protein
MAFDASPGVTYRTPIVRKGSPYLPFQAPDRIRTDLQNARVKDLLFVKHDVPIVDQGTQTATPGVLCDPTPDSVLPGSEYRTSSDYSEGASPIKLRGIFAVAALSDGYVGVIDVDDWDAKCRRPVYGNVAVTPPGSAFPLVDWRGCHDDSTDYYYANDTRTTSDESSCNVVEIHHARSSHFFGNNSTLGVYSPSLQALPNLTSTTGALSSGSTSRITANPRLLAVPFANSAAGLPLQNSELYVGSTHYYVPPAHVDGVGVAEVPSNASFLSVDPASATQNSLLLPQVEPRAYLSTENFSVTYEGELFADRVSGLLSKTTLELSDPDAYFCDQGVEDLDVATRRADDFISASDPSATDKKAAFGPAYADIVQITSDFTDSDPYWTTPDGSACALDTETGVSGIAGCRNYFGITDNFKSNRDWQITEAYQDRVIFQPVGDTAKDAAQAIANLRCCFPGTVMYTIRARNQWLFRGQQPMNNIVPGPGNRCVIEDTCSHRKQHLRNRIIEISSSAWQCDSQDPPECKCILPDTSGDCAIGRAAASDVACIVPSNDAVNPTNYTTGSNPLGQGCVFDSLKARFAIYRGTNPSVRDMSFNWQVTGGFVPYQLNLANRLTGSAIMPQSLIPAPNLNALFVVDGVSGGVFQIIMDPFGINGDPYL